MSSYEYGRSQISLPILYELCSMEVVSVVEEKRVWVRRDKLSSYENWIFFQYRPQGEEEFSLNALLLAKWWKAAIMVFTSTQGGLQTIWRKQDDWVNSNWVLDQLGFWKGNIVENWILMKKLSIRILSVDICS